MYVGTTSSTVFGWRLSSWRPGKVPLATLSTLRRSTWPVVSGGFGRSSNSRARISATAKGTGMSSRRLPTRCSVSYQLAQRVYVWSGIS